VPYRQFPLKARYCRKRSWEISGGISPMRLFPTEDENTQCVVEEGVL